MGIKNISSRLLGLFKRIIILTQLNLQMMEEPLNDLNATGFYI